MGDWWQVRAHTHSFTKFFRFGNIFSWPFHQAAGSDSLSVPKDCTLSVNSVLIRWCRIQMTDPVLFLFGINSSTSIFQTQHITLWHFTSFALSRHFPVPSRYTHSHRKVVWIIDIGGVPKRRLPRCLLRHPPETAFSLFRMHPQKLFFFKSLVWMDS